MWVPAAHAQNHLQKWPSSAGLLIVTFLMLLFLAALVGITALTLLFYYSDLIFPGVRIAEVPIGSQTRAQAAATLVETVPQQEVLLMHSSGAWPVTAGDLGMVLDVEASLQEAYDLGRTLPGLQRIVADGGRVEPQWTIDEERATLQLDRIAAEMRIPAENAQIVIEDGEVREVPAVEGIELDQEMTLGYLRENPSEILRSGRLALATTPIAAPISDAGVFASEARRLLSKPVTIHAYDPITDETADWQIQPGEWNKWLKLVVTPGAGEPFAWVVDESAAQQFLANDWSWLGEQRYLDAQAVVPRVLDIITSGKTGFEARVYHQPTQHTVRPGESFSSIGYNYGIPYPWIQQANPGINTLAVGDVVTVPSPDEMLPLPVVPDKRIVVSLSQQRAWVYEGGQLLWEWPISTGIRNSPTSPGVFQIQNHLDEAYASNWDLQMPNFMGIYRPVPSSDFMNGFHGFPTRDGANLLWTADLGHPVTYGCILLSSENAERLYGWAEEGVVVDIQR